MSLGATITTIKHEIDECIDYYKGVKLFNTVDMDQILTKAVEDAVMDFENAGTLEDANDAEFARLACMKYKTEQLTLN